MGHTKRIIGLLCQSTDELLGGELYTQNRARRNQFVGRVQMSVDDFVELLSEHNFEQTPFFELKTSIRDSIKEYSFKYPLADDGEYIHLVFYDGSEVRNAMSGELFVYACIKNYRGVDIDENGGVLHIREILNDEGIHYEFIQP